MRTQLYTGKNIRRRKPAEQRKAKHEYPFKCKHCEKEYANRNCAAAKKHKGVPEGCIVLQKTNYWTPGLKPNYVLSKLRK